MCNILYQKRHRKAWCTLYTSPCYTRINMAYLFQNNAQHFAPKMPTKSLVRVIHECALYLNEYGTLYINIISTKEIKYVYVIYHY